MNTIEISQVSFQSINSFFDGFNFVDDTKHIQKYISFIQEASLCYQNIIHQIYDANKEETVGFIALSTTREVDDISGVLVEFLYLKPDYRGKIDNVSQQKYSYIALDYIIVTAIEIQKKIAINHIYLVPIDNKVRKIYNRYGFENIPGSGSNEFEDYMVFNLLDEDPTIL